MVLEEEDDDVVENCVWKKKLNNDWTSCLFFNALLVFGSAVLGESGLIYLGGGKMVKCVTQLLFDLK